MDIELSYKKFSLPPDIKAFIRFVIINFKFSTIRFKAGRAYITTRTSIAQKQYYPSPANNKSSFPNYLTTVTLEGDLSHKKFTGKTEYFMGNFLVFYKT